MAYRVTKPVTKYGRKYLAGQVVDHPTSTEDSLARLFGWETIETDNTSADAPVVSLRSMTKAELVQLAESRGLDGSGLRKAELIDLLDE